MIKKYEFIERIIYLARKELSENLPEEATLDEMVDKAKKILKNSIYQ